MVNKIDKGEYKFIDLEFIQRTNLRYAPASIDPDGERSLKHLQNIVDSKLPMIKTICLEHAAVKEAYQTITETLANGSRIREFHFVWGRVILEFYYFYHETKEEALKIVDKMLFYEGVVFIKEAVQVGLRLIDRYFESEWTEQIPATTPKQKIKKPKNFMERVQEETLKLFMEEEQTEPQQPASEPLPDILQIMQDINSGKLRYDEVDWELQLKTLLFLCRLMPKKFPNVILVWGILGQLDDPAIKMDIISKLQEAAPKCFDDPFKANDFVDDCSCIYRICVAARAYNLRQDIGVRHTWTDERKDLNDLAHVFSDAMVDPQWMVGMIEEMGHAESSNRRVPMLEIVLKANRSTGQLSVYNIVDFAKKLYIAEGFRQMILSGQEDYREIPSLEKFDWRLRNKCFDIYIDLRKDQIKELLNQDNTRIDEADDFEVLQYMLKEEAAVVENELKMYQDPSAIDKWYPGMRHVKDMITVFIQYLPKKIEKMRKAEEAKYAVAPIYADTVNIRDNHGSINNFE